ncbi:MAG: rhodanese-like domain-containing protein [Methylococcales symbiont of Hymedesmia sp. n. MRB-2018]|nr:MAG: rhodanese-like domain-containing protein [Methylococcales symbiont of Hymedesmia sp. n. MRB-2018]
MNQNELAVLIKEGLAPIIIDVRSGFEYKYSHLPRAIHIPFWQVLMNDKLAEYEKNQATVLYCEHESRAILAKLILACIGFRDICYLKGHD